MAVKTVSIQQTMEQWASTFEGMDSHAAQIWREAGTVTAKGIMRSAAQKTPRRSGTAAKSWRLQHFQDSIELVNDAPHWPYIRTGTGVHGPKGTLIVPKGVSSGSPSTLVFRRDEAGRFTGGKVLVFIKEGETHHSKWSRGMEPRDPLNEVDGTASFDAGEAYAMDKLEQIMTGLA